MRTYSYEDGLNTYNIRKVVQDKNGFIWVGTQSGLFRFDGLEFEHFNTSTPELELPGNFITDLAVYGEYLVAAIYNSGIVIIHTTTLKTIHPGLNAISIFGRKVFSVSAEGDVVFGSEYGVCRVRFDSSIPKITWFKSLTLNILQDKLVLRDSCIWALKDHSNLYLLRNDPERIFLVDSSHLTDFISDMIIGQEGVLVLNNKELEKLSFVDNKILRSDRVRIPCDENETAEKLLNNGGGFVLLASKHCYFLNEKFSFLSRQAFPSNVGFVQGASIDHLRNVWVPTTNSLEFISSQLSPFRIFFSDSMSRIRLEHIYTLMTRGDSVIYACGKSGLFRVDLSSGKMTKAAGIDKNIVVHDIIHLKLDMFLVSTDAGLFLYNSLTNNCSQKELFQNFPTLNQISGLVINANLRVEDSLLLLGSENERGLVMWNLRTQEIKQFLNQRNQPTSIPENHIHHIRQDRNGRIWLLQDDGICSFDLRTEAFTPLVIKGTVCLKQGIFFDLYDDGKYYWICSFQKGLVRYNIETKELETFDQKEGLSNNACYSVLPENDSVIWVSTDNGLNRINTHTNSFQNFFALDGLQDNAFDEKCAAEDSEFLYFGGVNGFTQIRKKGLINTNQEGKVIIKSIELIDLSNRREKIAYDQDLNNIESDIIQLRLKLSILGCADAHKIRTEYRMNNGPWLITERGNQIVINNPLHGTLEIEFRIKNFDNSGPSRIGKFKTYVNPKWYQTTWFRLALLLLIAANATWITRLYFRRQLVAKQKELEKQQALQSQRDRISMDMHDDLGSGLSSIKMISELLKRKHNDAQTREELNQIVVEASDLTNTMRDLVWSLNPRNDSLEGFIDHSRRFVKQYFEQAEITVDFHADCEQTNRAMHGLARRNLLMILKETCTNIYKYAGSKHVEMRFQCLQDTLSIHICDHGIGLPDKVRENNGFYTMRKRMQEIGGQIRWHSDQSGLHTRIEWPIHAV